MKPKELALKAASLLARKQGQNVMVLEVSHLTSIADYFVIAGGRNVPHVRAMAEDVEDKLSALSVDARRSEGINEARWIVLDYSSVLVHIFHMEEREYYNIERLWMDGGNLIPLPEDEAETEA